MDVSDARDVARRLLFGSPNGKQKKTPQKSPTRTTKAPPQNVDQELSGCVSLAEIPGNLHYTSHSFDALTGKGTLLKGNIRFSGIFVDKLLHDASALVSVLSPFSTAQNQVWKNVFEGKFVEGCRSGRGKEMDPITGHIIFMGQYLKGVKCGRGIALNSPLPGMRLSSLVYAGPFRDGKRGGRDGVLFHVPSSVKTAPPLVALTRIVLPEDGVSYPQHLPLLPVEGPYSEYAASCRAAGWAVVDPEGGWCRGGFRPSKFHDNCLVGNRLYEGEFRNDLPSGRGVMFDQQTGQVCYMGEFQAGLKHGFGAEYDPATGDRLFCGQFAEGYRVEGNLDDLRSTVGPTEYTDEARSVISSSSNAGRVPGEDSPPVVAVTDFRSVQTLLYDLQLDLLSKLPEDFDSKADAGLEETPSHAHDVELTTADEVTSSVCESEEEAEKEEEDTEEEGASSCHLSEESNANFRDDSQTVSDVPIFGTPSVQSNSTSTPPSGDNTDAESQNNNNGTEKDFTFVECDDAFSFAEMIRESVNHHEGRRLAKRDYEEFMKTYVPQTHRYPAFGYAAPTGDAPKTPSPPVTEVPFAPSATSNNKNVVSSQESDSASSTGSQSLVVSCRGFEIIPTPLSNSFQSHLLFDSNANHDTTECHGSSTPPAPPPVPQYPHLAGQRRPAASVRSDVASSINSNMTSLSELPPGIPLQFPASFTNRVPNQQAPPAADSPAIQPGVSNTEAVSETLSSSWADAVDDLQTEASFTVVSSA